MVKGLYIEILYIYKYKISGEAEPYHSPPPNVKPGWFCQRFQWLGGKSGMDAVYGIGSGLHIDYINDLLCYLIIMIR